MCEEGWFTDGIGVSVVGSIPDANALIAEENRFNEPPALGNQFFITRVRIHNIGSAFVEYDPEIDLRAIGSDGVAYRTYENSCGVTPDECPGTLQLAADGAAECNLCWQVGTNEASTMLMFWDSIRLLPETGEPFFFDLVP